MQHLPPNQSLASSFPPCVCFGPNKFSAAPPITSSYFLSGTALRKQSELRARGGLDGQRLTRQEGSRDTGTHTQDKRVVETGYMWIKAVKPQRLPHNNNNASCFKLLKSQVFDFQMFQSPHVSYLLFSCTQMTRRGSRLTEAEVQGCWFPMRVSEAQGISHITPQSQKPRLTHALVGCKTRRSWRRGAP